ncbi:exodeoxyribonuclease VII small subunit [Candidatus Microgenomates bacterium]|nr:exodeoxyribonuclease VII small subunit [Candidatus Microgenomates bacterium]
MSPPPKKSADFSKDLKELETIVEWFESGEVDLDAALPKFERGLELANRLRSHLETVQNQVEVIKQKFKSTDPPAAAEPDLPGPDQLL